MSRARSGDHRVRVLAAAAWGLSHRQGGERFRAPQFSEGVLDRMVAEAEGREDRGFRQVS